jgi:hypothetical protein
MYLEMAEQRRSLARLQDLQDLQDGGERFVLIIRTALTLP